MSRYFNGLTTVNVELTSRCNKDCWMCGRRKVDRDHPEITMNYGDMDLKLVASIAKQLPDGIVVQLHRMENRFYTHNSKKLLDCLNVKSGVWILTVNY